MLHIMTMMGITSAMLTKPTWRYTKRGGMRFLRIGRVQMSWCVVKREAGQ